MSESGDVGVYAEHKLLYSYAITTTLTVLRWLVPLLVTHWYDIDFPHRPPIPGRPFDRQ
jgi:hypothetical protein